MSDLGTTILDIITHFNQVVNRDKPAEKSKVPDIKTQRQQYVENELKNYFTLLDMKSKITHKALETLDREARLFHLSELFRLIYPIQPKTLRVYRIVPKTLTKTQIEDQLMNIPYQDALVYLSKQLCDSFTCILDKNIITFIDGFVTMDINAPSITTINTESTSEIVKVWAYQPMQERMNEVLSR